MPFDNLIVKLVNVESVLSVYESLYPIEGNAELGDLMDKFAPLEGYFNRYLMIRNAVLMIDDVLADEKELGALVETTVYKHIVSFHQGSTAQIGYFRKTKDNKKEVEVVIEHCQSVTLTYDK